MSDSKGIRKQRLFVDMDGVLAVFHQIDTLELLYEKGYFRNLEPIPNVVDAVREIIKNNQDIEVYILSAVLDSRYAMDEKNEWLDEHLPEIDEAHRIFTRCGEDKKDFIRGGVREDDFLLDDYTKNLTSWQPPARAIKLLNGINHTMGTWQHDRLSCQRSGSELALSIEGIMKDKIHIKDDVLCRHAFVEKTAEDEMEFGK